MVMSHQKCPEEGIWAEYHTIHMCNDEDDYDDIDDDYQNNN